MELIGDLEAGHGEEVANEDIYRPRKIIERFLKVILGPSFHHLLVFFEWAQLLDSQFVFCAYQLDAALQCVIGADAPFTIRNRGRNHRDVVTTFAQGLADSTHRIKVAYQRVAD